MLSMSELDAQFEIQMRQEFGDDIVSFSIENRVLDARGGQLSMLYSFAFMREAWVADNMYSGLESIWIPILN